MNQIDLAGQHAVVTGGAQGIGFAIAKRLAASGAKITLWDMSADQLETAKASLAGAGSVVVDVSDAEAVVAAHKRSEAAGGPVSICVNSAGIAGPNAPLDAYDLGWWRKVIDVNVNGTFYVNRAVVPSMKARNYGRIVNIASVAGKEGNPNAAAYSAAKAGVIALTKSLGKELAQTGVRVNCITPAAIKTDMFAQMTQQHIDYMLSKIPLGRFGTVEEMAALIAWLASEDCSFSTGGVFDVSGGRADY